MPLLKSNAARSLYCSGAKIVAPDVAAISVGDASPFLSRRNVKRVQPLVIVGCSILGHRDHKNRAMSPRISIDHRRRRDADLRLHLEAAATVAGGVACAEGARLS